MEQNKPLSPRVEKWAKRIAAVIVFGLLAVGAGVVLGAAVFGIWWVW